MDPDTFREMRRNEPSYAEKLKEEGAFREEAAAPTSANASRLHRHVRLSVSRS
jgi:hypothetical protein